MAAVAIEQQQLEVPLSNAAVRRTQARPKNSLFGTALEVYDADDVESIRKIELKDHKHLLSEQKKKEKLRLPESIRSQLLSGLSNI